MCGRMSFDAWKEGSVSKELSISPSSRGDLQPDKCVGVLQADIVGDVVLVGDAGLIQPPDLGKDVTFSDVWSSTGGIFLSLAAWISLENEVAFDSVLSRARETTFCSEPEDCLWESGHSRRSESDARRGGDFRFVVPRFGE